MNRTQDVHSLNNAQLLNDTCKRPVFFLANGSANSQTDAVTTAVNGRLLPTMQTGNP